MLKLARMFLNPKERWNAKYKKRPENRLSSNYAKEKEKLFPRNSVVCDLGGGDGTDSFYFIQKGHKVYLLDLSDYGLSLAKEKAKALGLKTKLIAKEVDLTKDGLPLKSDSADIVYSHLSLHYFPLKRMVEIFKEIYRVLKDGGKAFVVIKSPEDIKEMAALRKVSKEIEEGIFEEGILTKTRFTKRQYESALKESGINNFKVRDYIEETGSQKFFVKSQSEKLLYIEIIINK